MTRRRAHKLLTHLQTHTTKTEHAVKTPSELNNKRHFHTWVRLSFIEKFESTLTFTANVIVDYKPND